MSVRSEKNRAAVIQGANFSIEEFCKIIENNASIEGLSDKRDASEN